MHLASSFDPLIHSIITCAFVPTGLSLPSASAQNQIDMVKCCIMTLLTNCNNTSLVMI